MTTLRRLLPALLALALVALVPAAALSKGSKPSATLTLESKSVSVGVGWSWGGGTLRYGGKRYPFKIDGLQVIAVGAEKVDATGNVYNLKRLKDFEGTYTAVEAGGSVGAGAAIATMKNQNGVRITLHSRSQGVSAQAGPEGMKITLK